MDDPVSIIKYGKVSCLSLTVTNKRIKKNTFTKKERSAINLNFCNPEKNQYLKMRTKVQFLQQSKILNFHIMMEHNKL